MNESASAPVDPSAPRVESARMPGRERLAAGVLALVWVGWKYWVNERWRVWWVEIRVTASQLVYDWQGVVGDGNLEQLMQWSSQPFAKMLLNTSYLTFQLGIVGLVL